MSGEAEPPAWRFFRFALFVTGEGERDFLPSLFEAYYFADAPAVNAVPGTELTDFDGDVETIGHRKNDLTAIARALGAGRNFDEVRDGRAILESLDVVKVLSQPATCRSLRTVFAWCWRAMGKPATERFQLADGQLSPVTGVQLDRLPGLR